MSQLLYKYFLQKTQLDQLVTFGDTQQDPYFEEIPENELHFYQRKGAKRRRKLPNFIPDHDMKILNSVKNRAYRLDLQLSLCGIRIGWAGVIGLIPWIGDLIAFYFALQLVRKAKTVEGGLPKSLETEMMANVMFDFGIGLIPIVGDFINVLYKCNSRNFVLLEKHLVKKYGNKETIPGGGNKHQKQAAAAAATTAAPKSKSHGSNTNRPVPPPPTTNVPGTYDNDRMHQVHQQV
ncbi:hypothetical protein Cantr_08328 [Candida viswanathii]|uniref:Uncharacterized protein n=1 Tax=Candida viswanathii TaxID=5486 RepID=A0A367Y6F8_9ASCO|nr:hypothetical protein Cantr_08328 [Candida viswanathii]